MKPNDFTDISVRIAYDRWKTAAPDYYESDEDEDIPISMWVRASDGRVTGPAKTKPSSQAGGPALPLGAHVTA